MTALLSAVMAVNLGLGLANAGIGNRPGVVANTAVVVACLLWRLYVVRIAARGARR